MALAISNPCDKKKEAGHFISVRPFLFNVKLIYRVRDTSEQVS